METNITWYTDNLRAQVIELFVNEYGVDRAEFHQLFERFYFHPYQQNKCLLVVAMDGGTVAGFQSFFYWPYTFAGKTFQSYQSGNSLVHPGYRGKRIFNRMLEFLDRENKNVNIDFLMGFPVEASLKNFLKDKWQHILDLRWYIRPCNPLGFFVFTENERFESGCVSFDATPETNVLRLSPDPAFVAWRKSYLSGRYFSFRHGTGDMQIIFHLKSNKRKRILNELIIGNILFRSSTAFAGLEDALAALVRAARNSFGTHFLSIAINERSAFDTKTPLLRQHFRRSDKKIHFIAKPFGANEFVLRPENWLLYRSDIDTW